MKEKISQTAKDAADFNRVWHGWGLEGMKMGIFDLFTQKEPDLYKMGHKRDVKGLIKALTYKGENYIGIHREAGKTLNWLSEEDESVIKLLIRALKNKDRSVRNAATETLCEIGDVRAVVPLIQALEDEPKYWDEHMYEEHANMYVPYRVAMFLGDIRDSRAIEPLIRALKYRVSSVRWEAAFALGKIGDLRAVEPLIQALEDVVENVRWKAAWALGKIGDVRAVEPLIQALKDRDEYVRKYAAQALGEIKDSRSVEPLIKALKDEDSNVRKAAQEALDKINAKKS